MKPILRHPLIACLVLFIGVTSFANGENPKPKDLKKINHIIIIYLENHSFDNLYGQFPGANGLSNAKNVMQIDSSGKPFQFLPSIPGTDKFPKNLPNSYFNIDQYVPADMKIPDLTHRYYQEQAQINGGKMDRFAEISN